MKTPLLALATIAILVASLSSCAGQKAKRLNTDSSARKTIDTMSDTTKIGIDTDNIDIVTLLYADRQNVESVMPEKDHAGFAGYLSTAVYDTVWNDSGIMVKMVVPDYTAIISYKNRPADDNDWLMVWKEGGRAKFRQKWFFIAESDREGLYALLDKNKEVGKGIGMTVFPQRNGGAPQKLDLTVHNNTDEVIRFGAGYSIERLVDREWIGVDLGNFAVITIMYGIQPGDSGKYTINLYTDRVTYPEGDYRVVKQINIGEGDALPYYAGFRIIEPR